MDLILLSVATTLIVVKDVAYLWSLANLPRLGGALADRVRAGTAEQIPHFPALGNPIDRQLERLSAGGSRAGALLRATFTAPAVIVVASVVQFGAGSSEHSIMTYALGIATALCSILVVVTAVLRRLAFGVNDWKTSDVQLPNLPSISRWAVIQENGTNKSVYFLVLVYLSVLGFSALYNALGATDPSGFAPAGEASSWITWLYFSFATLATVGYGDIHPVSDAAKVAVTCQIASGPLLLSWLLAVFLSSKAPDES
jgi:hypothetical protein